MEPSSLHDQSGYRKDFGVGFWIWWTRADDSRGGPSQVWMVVLSNQRRWAYVEFEGNGVWVSEDLITQVVHGSGSPRKGIDPPDTP